MTNLQNPPPQPTGFRTAADNASRAVLTIDDERGLMSSTATHHTATRILDVLGGWSVSWLPGTCLDRNQAISAMTIAERVAGRDLDNDLVARISIKSFASELGLGYQEAVDKVRAATPHEDRP